MNCLFCKIAIKEIPAEVIYEDDYAIAFLDINPIAPGHTLIIPKQHAASVRDLDEDLVGPVSKAVRRTAMMLFEALAPDGLSYGINEGVVTGQAIQHLHIHIVPRWSSDGGKSFHSIVHNPPTDTLESIANKIRQVSENL